MRKICHCTLLMIVASAVTLTSCSALAQEGFEGWNLEPSIAQAHLVMVARVTNVSEVTVVEGAKTDVSLREFRFQPVARLKGIFQRDELSMTASDLGISAESAAAASPLHEGEYRLLILVQPQGLTSYGCVTAGPGAQTFDERVPKLNGPDDPLVSVIETLIQVADSRSRKERATLLIDRLLEVDGLAAVLLLNSLQQRADWAAADGRSYGPVKSWAGDGPAPGLLAHAGSPARAVRLASITLLRDMLATGVMPGERPQLERIADVLRGYFEIEEPDSRIRLAALEAMSHLLRQSPKIDGVRDFLLAQLSKARTYAERGAAATALAHLGDPDAAQAVLTVLKELPLDEPFPRELLYARAAAKLDSKAAEDVLLARLEQSVAARQSISSETVQLGSLRSKQALPILLAVADLPDLSKEDRESIAVALGQLNDDQAVPLLTQWLRDGNRGPKQLALTALEKIDSPVVARELRPLLKSEPNLSNKLRIARVLARHGYADGYALATEHLADHEHTAAAALVLAELKDPRTVADLNAIVTNRPDRRWRAAALTGLAAFGDDNARKQILDILREDRHPLVADAAIAAGLAKDGALLEPLPKLVQSRNQQIARNTLLALRRFFSDGLQPSADIPVQKLFAASLPEDAGETTPSANVPAETRTALIDTVASLASDAYVDVALRQEALAVARLLGGQRYQELLTELADQAELESTPILSAVQADRRRLAQDSQAAVQVPASLSSK